jgi:hypothetical protein
LKQTLLLRCLQGGKDISTKPVSFSGASGLQVNVSGLPNIADKVIPAASAQGTPCDL